MLKQVICLYALFVSIFIATNFSIVLARTSITPLYTMQNITCDKPNEQFVNCILAQCKHLTCTDLKYKNVPCPGIAPPCAGGCVCKDGFLRDVDEVCIPEEDCVVPRK